jgi:death on curing protein
VSEPKWLSRFHIQAIHDSQILEHGGSPGLRNPEALEATLGRVQTYWQYQSDADVCQLAAVLGHGLCSSHPFVDGNKRTTLLAMYVYLGLNGTKLVASEPDAVRVILLLAHSQLEVDDLAIWIRSNSIPRA